MTFRALFGIGVKEPPARPGDSPAGIASHGDGWGDYWPSDFRDDDHWETGGQTARDDWRGSD